MRQYLIGICLTELSIFKSIFWPEMEHGLELFTHIKLLNGKKLLLQTFVNIIDG